jgi:hypothetical protein
MSVLAGSWWLTLVILATLEAEIRSMAVQGQPRQMVQEIPIFKITRAKWTGGMAKAVECLLCKSEALSSDSRLPPYKNVGLC